jgi:hypothetical protein
MCCALFFSETARNKCDVLRPVLLFPKAHEQPIRCVVRSAFPKLSFDPRHMLRPLCPKHMFLESLRVALSCFSTKTLCVVLSCHSTKTLSVIPCVMLSPLPKPLMQSARGCALLFKNYPRKSLGVCCVLICQINSYKVYVFVLCSSQMPRRTYKCALLFSFKSRRPHFISRALSLSKCPVNSAMCYALLTKETRGK